MKNDMPNIGIMIKPPTWVKKRMETPEIGMIYA